MAQAQGAQGTISIMKESVFGSSSSAASEKLNFLTESLRLTQPLISSDTITGTRNPTKPIQGNKDVAGDLSMELQSRGIDILFYGLLGDAETQTGSDPYTHTLNVGSTIPSFTIEKSFTDNTDYFLYNGVVVNSASLSVTQEGFQEVSFGLVGAKETASAAAWDSSPTARVKTSFGGSNINLIKEGSTLSSISNVMSVDFTIENNADTSVYVIDTSTAGIRAAIPAGIIKVTGTLTAMFENLELYTKATAPTATGLQINYRYDANNQFSITIPEMYFSPQAPVIEGPTGVKVELPFEAYESAGVGLTCQVVVINDIDRAGDGTFW